MKPTLNPLTVLFGIGVLQPCRLDEVKEFLAEMLEFPKDTVETSSLNELANRHQKSRNLVKVGDWPRPLYSLTLKGQRYLTKDLRLLRDKLRLHLLRKAHLNRIRLSRGEEALSLAGDSPVVTASTQVKGVEANKLGRRRSGQVYWPRLSEQFRETGSKRVPRDTLPPFLSFATRAEFVRALGKSSYHSDWSTAGLAAALGISPRLVQKISESPSRFYRTFSIPKRSGGERIIDSPRTFLKVIQWFLADFVLAPLEIHETVHSFRPDHSIVSNAERHAGKRFIANIDIVNFFPSLTAEHIVRCLRRNGFSEQSARTIASLCTKGDQLPQGAPTSPVLSNLVLYPFDDYAASLAAAHGAVYTRYADDITLSCDNKSEMVSLLPLLEAVLHADYSLRLNSKKTRINSFNSQQVVTGLVVNRWVNLSRRKRRNIRAMFHKAEGAPEQFVGRLDELRGHVAFLNMVTSERNKAAVARYRRVIEMVTLASQSKAD